MTGSDFKDSVLGYLNKKAVLAKENADSYRNICNDEMAVGNAHRADVAFKAWGRSLSIAGIADALVARVEDADNLPTDRLPCGVSFWVTDKQRDAAELMYSQACAYAKAQ